MPAHLQGSRRPKRSRRKAQDPPHAGKAGNQEARGAKFDNLPRRSSVPSHCREPMLIPVARCPRTPGIVTWPCCRVRQRDCSCVQLDDPAFQRGPYEALDADHLHRKTRVMPCDRNTISLPAPQGSWVRHLAARGPGVPEQCMDFKAQSKL